MLHNAARGLVAGALGTVALNVVTYLDVTLRGRPTSSVPADTAGRLADAAGVDLGGDEAAQSRRTGLGALFGYVTGLGIGLLYGGSGHDWPRSPSPSPPWSWPGRPWRPAT